MSGDRVRLSAAELEDGIAAALERSRTSRENARAVARALAAAEVDGQAGHGLSRVPAYAAQSERGKVDGFAVPTLTQARPAALLVDARHGFAYPAIDLALPALAKAARAEGVALAAITRSHHFGVAGRTAERLAEEGLVGLIVGNAPKAMAPHGAKTALLGTNPIAFAAPIPGRAPLVVDLALSEVARGKIMVAAQKGEPIPPGWAVDKEGRPTTDAKAALEGALTPLGGAKGAALAIMVEVLAVALTGAVASRDASSFFDAEGPPPGIGQTILAIDPAAYAGSAVFAEKIMGLVAAIEAEGARLPGTKRIARREAAARAGVEVDGPLWARVVALGVA